MPKHPVTLALVALSLGLMGCASAAGVPGVPPDASARWDMYSGYKTYRWERTLQTGCASWVMTDLDLMGQIAAVHLSEGPANCDDGPGVAYQTPTDYLVFKNYWPWPLGQSVVAVANGEITGYLPCPHALSPEQIGRLRAVAQEANARATTDAERRTLTRIDQLLAATDGGALASGQQGCTDLPLTIDAGVDRTQDTWRGTQRVARPVQ